MLAQRSPAYDRRLPHLAERRDPASRLVPWLNKSLRGRTFGLLGGSGGYMLAFSTAGDLVEPENIGTSAAIVNGIMFIAGGITISRPFASASTWRGINPETLEIAQDAGRVRGPLHCARCRLTC